MTATIRNASLRATVALIGAILFACQSQSPSMEDEAQIRRLFSRLSHDLPGSSPSDVRPYLTESGHHESAGPYHHQPIVELLMTFRSLRDVDIEVQSITVTDGRAHARCLVRGRELLRDGSTEMVMQEQIFELLREPDGWRIADHRIS